ncbi:MAG: hypothetical protein H0X51_06810 [Parachlamydiaceae bacterium]|nr:hypothetical protein [Parachlamydiaceae bacterium]
MDLKKSYLVSCIVCLCVLLMTGCQRSYDVDNPPEPVLSTINIIDRNGFAETISSEDRLARYTNVDFCSTQPYQKVLRVYGRDFVGNICARINSYHPNGQPKQYLEVVNNRAYGIYREWHTNGVMKVEAFIIGGEADIDTGSERSWLFDGTSYAWDECGNLLAEILYCHGELQGSSAYYHSNGNIWKKFTCEKGFIHGPYEVFTSEGTLLQSTEYVFGTRNGPSKRFWSNCSIAADETYCDGLLTNASYYGLNQALICSIKNGSGYRAVFGRESVSEYHQYQSGIPEGEVKILDSTGTLARIYHVKKEVKDGEEIEYYTTLETKTKDPRPKLSVTWNDGVLHGLTKTWYPNGVQESQREMTKNVKNGVLTAWYEDGSLMLIEKYDQNKLITGEYYVPNERTPTSVVKSGKGTATIFDSKGNFLQKISYLNSRPSES